MKLSATFRPLGLGLLTLASQGCKPSLEAPGSSAGKADFTTYVAVGNSLTAGFQSNGLFYQGQINSYPSILAKAMQNTGNGPATFNQPLFPVNSEGTGHLTLAGFDKVAGTPIIAITPGDASQIIDYTSTAALGEVAHLKNVADDAIIHNLGVPGIRISDVKNPDYGVVGPFAYNNYFERLLPDNLGHTSYLAFVSRSKPSFFTNWLGNNDVLGYASSGGASAAQFLTPIPSFVANYTEVLDSLMRTAKGGLLVTLPNVTSAPYFTTVSPANITLTAAQASPLNDLIFIRYNNKVDSINHKLDSLGDPRRLRKAVFHVGPGNIPLVEDKSNPLLAPLGFLRPLMPDSGELILLTAAAVLPLGYGTAVGSPVPSPAGLANEYVLTTKEMANIAATTTGINDFIRATAKDRGLALFDAELFLKELKTGNVYFDGTQITADFISGGAFSLDGVHPSTRGYALIANKMMEAINATYGATLSPVNAVDYPAVLFPK